MPHALPRTVDEGKAVYGHTPHRLDVLLEAKASAAISTHYLEAIPASTYWLYDEILHDAVKCYETSHVAAATIAMGKAQGKRDDISE
jgi:hypothetical protein